MPCLVQCLKSVTRRRNRGAEIARTDIARPDKTAPDQTARLNNVYSRLQCLRAVSHSVGAHTACLQLRDDDSSSSSENEDEDQQEPVPVATTSPTSDSTTAAEATASDDFCEVCFVAPRGCFALVPCGHARCYLATRDSNAQISQVSRCPPLRYGAVLSSLAMSASTISMVSRCQVSRFQSPPYKLVVETDAALASQTVSDKLDVGLCQIRLNPGKRSPRHSELCVRSLFAG